MDFGRTYTAPAPQGFVVRGDFLKAVVKLGAEHNSEATLSGMCTPVPKATCTQDFGIEVCVEGSMLPSQIPRRRVPLPGTPFPELPCFHDNWGGFIEQKRTNQTPSYPLPCLDFPLTDSSIPSAPRTPRSVGQNHHRSLRTKPPAHTVPEDKVAARASAFTSSYSKVHRGGGGDSQ